MKQGISFSQTIAIMSVFILMVFALLSATLSYYKAFKINNAIASIVEKYEGYNDLSIREITQKLSSMGYKLGTVGCKKTFSKKSTPVDSSDKQHAYCIYQYGKKDGYFSYGIETYIFVELPFGVHFKLPVYSETEPIFMFSN